MKFNRVVTSSLLCSVLNSSLTVVGAFSGRVPFALARNHQSYVVKTGLDIRGGERFGEHLTSSSSLSQSSSTATEEDEKILKIAADSKDVIGSGTEVQKFGTQEFVDIPPSLHRVVFVLGGPGAGKGTQSAKLVESYDGSVLHLSVGDLLRNAEGSPHAELIADCLENGKIVPVEISLDLLQRAMEEASKESKCGQPTFLVDGYPRNFDNLTGWTAQMTESSSVLGALVYECPEDELERRILSRGETSGRSDDNLASIKKRFITFQEQTMPVVDTLAKIPFVDVKYISGTGTIEEVWAKTQQCMNQFISNDVFSANKRLIQAIESNDVETYSQLVLTESDSEEYFKENETLKDDEELVLDPSDVTSILSNVSVEVQNGTKAVVTYDRKISSKDNETATKFKETRVWSHEKNGWMCIHFHRKPVM